MSHGQDDTYVYRAQQQQDPEKLRQRHQTVTVARETRDTRERRDVNKLDRYLISPAPLSRAPKFIRCPM